jgi:tripartite-type tricarboxylate transporter receptor subunit TctC
VASTGEVGRSIITTPGVPAERLTALRNAFQAMLKDKDFLAACQQRKLMIDPGTGEDMDKIVEDTTRLPKDVIAKVGQIMQ